MVVDRKILAARIRIANRRCRVGFIVWLLWDTSGWVLPIIHDQRASENLGRTYEWP
jgi:hypothetical protein